MFPKIISLRTYSELRRNLNGSAAEIHFQADRNPVFSVLVFWSCCSVPNPRHQYLGKSRRQPGAGGNNAADCLSADRSYPGARLIDYDNFLSVPAEVEVPNVAELIVVNNSNVTKILLYPTCHDQVDGRIRATIAGGTAPYNYEWIGNGSTSTVSNPLGLGNHTFRVTDANLCQTDSTFVVDTPSVILPNPDIASLGCISCNQLTLRSP